MNVAEHPSGMRPSAPVLGGATPCSARKTNGDPCGQAALSGTTVCGYHGGRAPQVQRVARRRVVEAEIAKELASLTYEPVEDPIPVLQDLAGKASAIADFVAAKAAAADDPATIDALGAALDRAHKFAESLQRLGLDERRLRLEEGQAALVWAALAETIERMGLESQSQEILDVFEVAYAELEKANGEGGK